MLIQKIICLIIALLPLTLNAQHAAIKGHLTGTDGDAVAGATISIDSLDKSTFSNAEGYFELRKLPPGTHKFTVRSLGFERYSRTVNLYSDQD